MCVDWNLVVDLLTLAVTVYFTFQLVKNDNARERRANVERDEVAKERLKSQLILEFMATNDQNGILQMRGKALANKHGVDVVMEAYYDYMISAAANGGNPTSIEKFTEMLRDVGVNVKSGYEL